MKHTYIILLVLVLTIGTKSETLDSLSITKSSNSVIKEKKEVKYDGIDYKPLYENQKEFNNSLLSTVYWALASILVVILAIVGSNLYLNFRFNKKQYDELANKYETKINGLEKALIENVNQKIRKFEEDQNKILNSQIETLSSNQNERIKEVNDEYKERLNSFSENLKEQITAIKDRFEHTQKDNKDKIENIEKLIVETINNSKNEINSLKLSIEKSISYNAKSLRIDIIELESEIWKSKDFYSLALMSYLRQSLICIEVEMTWKLKYSLNNILEMLKKTEKLSDYNSELFDKLIPLIPDDYSIQKSEIIGLLDLMKEKNK